MPALICCGRRISGIRRLCCCLAANARALSTRLLFHKTCKKEINTSDNDPKSQQVSNEPEKVPAFDNSSCQDYHTDLNNSNSIKNRKTEAFL